MKGIKVIKRGERIAQEKRESEVPVTTPNEIEASQDAEKIIGEWISDLRQTKSEQLLVAQSLLPSSDAT
jgi:hypothetical protein